MSLANHPYAAFVHEVETPARHAGGERFPLVEQSSAGRGSMLLCGLLYLAGCPAGVDDLRRFRRLGRRTPGRSETVATPGAEATTRPPGPGNSVGRALAGRALRHRFPGLSDRRAFAPVPDGDRTAAVADAARSAVRESRRSPCSPP